MGENKLFNILLLVIMLAVVLIGFLSISTATTLIRINNAEEKLRKTLVQKEQTIGHQRTEIESLKQELDEQRSIVKELKDNLIKQTNIVLNAVRSRKELGYVRRLPGYEQLTVSQKLAIKWLLDEQTSKEGPKGTFLGDHDCDFDLSKSRRIDRVRDKYLNENSITDLQSLDSCYYDIMAILDDGISRRKRVF